MSVSAGYANFHWNASGWQRIKNFDAEHEARRLQHQVEQQASAIASLTDNVKHELTLRGELKEALEKAEYERDKLTLDLAESNVALEQSTRECDKLRSNYEEEQIAHLVLRSQFEKSRLELFAAKKRERMNCLSEATIQRLEEAVADTVRRHVDAERAIADRRLASKRVHE